MGVLEKLEPKKVFEFFETITRIPHGSTDTGRISDFCENFAKERGLRYIRDDAGNIIIWKDASPSYENSPSVILQGHLDMVCEKDDQTDIDFRTDGLKIRCDGDLITAEGTTLGGDDGIAVAYCLAILDSDEYVHPPLECVFTVDEEIGMLGAAALDTAPLKSRLLINIDSEDEGHLLVGCAGGVTSTVHIPITMTEKDASDATSYGLIRLSVEGLVGGHSGIEIATGRANAVKLLGRVLFDIKKKSDFDIVNIRGGAKDNAIPRSAAAVLFTKESERVKALAAEYEHTLKHEYGYTDPGLALVVLDARDTESDTVSVFDEDSTNRVIAAMVGLPNGVAHMCHEPKGQVQTSLNLGILKTTDEEVSASFSVRSNIGSQKDALVSSLECIANSLGGYIRNTGAYPAWEYREESKLRDIFLKVYKEKYGKDMIVETIHAGVECGLLADKMEGLDAISFGPDMCDIHTPAESLSVSSAARTWELLLGVLRELK